MGFFALFSGFIFSVFRRPKKIPRTQVPEADTSVMDFSDYKAHVLWNCGLDTSHCVRTPYGAVDVRLINEYRPFQKWEKVQLMHKYIPNGQSSVVVSSDEKLFCGLHRFVRPFNLCLFGTLIWRDRDVFIIGRCLLICFWFPAVMGMFFWRVVRTKLYASLTHHDAATIKNRWNSSVNLMQETSAGAW